MSLFAKFISENEIEYAPKNKGSIVNYNKCEKLLLDDGYKPVVLAEVENFDRHHKFTYEETTSNIIQLVNYFETEEEFLNRKKNEEYQLEIDLLESQLKEVDFKRIRALCEPSVKDENTGLTWLDYYNAQIYVLREKLQALKERINGDVIIE